MGGPRRGNDGAELVGLDPHQFVGGQRLDLRHQEIRPFMLDQGAQRARIGHVDHMAAMGDLASGGVGVAVHGDGFHPQPLQFDNHFLA